MRPIVDRLVAKNYGCLKDVDIRLTPLHCFIGPNDSGKSTLLRAVEVLSLSLKQSIPHIVQRRHEYDLLLKPMDSPQSLLGAWSGGYCLYVDDAQGTGFTASFGTGVPESFRRKIAFNKDNPITEKPGHESVGQMKRALSGTRTFRLDQDALRRDGELIQGPIIDFVDDRGRGLPAVYDALASQDTEEYVKLVLQVKNLFPSVKKLQLIGTSQITKAINVELVTGERIEPQHLSTGLLYYLAYASIPYLYPCSILLIEEPENGLHPARIAEVMGILREVSRTTQVLIATHSPLVVNELEPEEVSVVTRQPDTGTKVNPLIDTPNFEARSKVYALGELWLSYANGTDEGPLLNPPDAEQD